MVASAIDAVARAEGLSAADALVRMAEIAQATLNDGAQPPRSLRGDERAAVVVHLDAARVPEAPAELAEAEPRSRERARPCARVAGGPGLPDAVVARLLCSGRIRTVVHERDSSGRSNVVALGRSHRVVTERMFRALLIRDGGCCTHPGCASTPRLEAHHVRHWIHGGRTDLANLVLLCERHHHAHHDGEFSIVPLGPGRFRFLRSDGRELPARVDPATLITTSTPIEDEHAGVAPAAATTRWDGQRMDRHYAVAVLAERRRVDSLG